ncbi:GNAT family N-acetyltransferase [Candidatus Falkowbacteria bacterium]|nr:GNAT family N-acetyltransferase [Candidatus Falkowbacteria bacterium]
MSVNVIYKEKDEQKFWQLWDQLVNETKASTRYLKITLDAWYIISKYLSLYHSDKSFIYEVNGQPLAGVFLPIEKKNGQLIGSIMDDYIDAPIFSDRSVEKKVFGIIDEIAKDNKLEKIMFLVDPLEDVNYNFLQKYNYFDTSILNYVIDLETDDLMSNIRKGHRGDIKKILEDKDFSVFCMDKENQNYAVHEEYRKLHHKCSGRLTRPKETFDAQFEKLKLGYAVLFGLKRQEKIIAFSYYEFHGSKAAYASAADDPDYDKLPLYHVLMYKAMEYLKQKGVRYIDTEPPSAPSAQFDYYPGDKELNIALFKRGFGGHFVQNFRGVKYFSKESFGRDLENLINNYSKLIV